VERLLSDTQEEIRNLRSGQDQWSQQLSQLDSEFDEPGSGSDYRSDYRSQRDDSELL